jgi:hypothetical protein
MNGFYFPAERPRLSDAERRELARKHYRQDYAWPDSPEEVLDPVFLDIPVCGECGEPWGSEGCATVRLLALLGFEERARATAEQERKQAIFALNEIAVRGEYYRANDRSAEIRMKVAEIALVQGGIGVVDATLSKIRTDMKAWLDNLNRDPKDEMARALNTAIANYRKGMPREG